MKRAELKKIDRLKLQYFSKLHKKWIDFKTTDRLESLMDYKYEIRVNPLYEKFEGEQRE